MEREETLLQTDDVRVRVMALQPGESNHWHFHTEVADHFVALTGEILLSLQGPEAQLKLGPGERFTVEVGRAHRVANASQSGPASYLLIQGVGRYDFNPTDPASS
jgi:quercetin dioxygenase-like cupin family protein